MIAEDLYNIADRIHALDRRFTVQRNAMDGSYTIYQNGYFFQTVPHDEFDERVVKHIRKVIYINIHGDIEGYVEKQNDKITKGKEAKLKDIGTEMAHDFRKAIKKGVD